MDLTPELIEGLEAALRFGGSTHSIADVVQQTLAGDAQLWVEPDAVIVTEVLQMPNARVLNFWLAAGKRAALLPLHRRVLTWGKSIGCDRAVMVGRSGWERILRDDGWAPSSIVLERKL